MYYKRKALLTVEEECFLKQAYRLLRSAYVKVTVNICTYVRS